MSNGSANKKDSSIARNTGAVALFSLLTAVSGLLIDILLAGHFGLGRLTDAFYAAYTVPFFLATIAFSLGYSTLIPVFSRYVSGRSPDELSPFLSTYMNIAGLAGVALSLSGYFLSGAIIGVVAPGLDPETAGVAMELSKVLFVLVMFSVVAEVLRAFLYANGAFVLASSSNFIRNGVVVASLLLFYDTQGIKSAAYGYTAGYAAQFLALGFRVFTKYSIRYGPRIDRGAWGLRDCFRIGAAQWAGFSILQGITFAERIIGSYLPSGSITALSYASRIVYMAVEFLSGSIATATLPKLSLAVGAGDAVETANVLRMTFRVVLLMFLPITVAVVLLSEPMIAVLYKRGAFTQEAVELTAAVFMLYSLSFVLQAYNRVIHNYLFAAMNPRGSLALFITITTITVLSDLLLVGWIGIYSLPAGYLIGSGAAFVLGYTYFIRGLKLIGGGDLKTFVRKTAVMSLLFGICFYGVFRLAQSVLGAGGAASGLLSLLVGLVPAAALAYVSARFMGLKEAGELHALIKQRLAGWVR